jgi:micrococcal nuclease
MFSFKFLLFLFTCIIYHAQSYKVIGIIDGDTYDILVENRPVRVRMYAIDAPERGMPYNKVAKKYLSDLIFGKMVNIKQTDTDKNGRIVAKTYLPDGREASTEMLRAGYAWNFKKYDNTPALAQMEITARKNKLGLWAENEPIAHWEVRKMHRNGVSTKEMFENSIK